MRTIIRIANPTPDGSTYTSGKSALKKIRKGEAMLTSDGELFFFTSAYIQEQREVQRVDDEIERNQPKGMIFWNGSDTETKATHRPGEVRC